MNISYELIMKVVEMPINKQFENKTGMQYMKWFLLYGRKFKRG